MARRPRGRPPIDGYRPEFALRAFKLGLLGLTLPELAERLGISVATLERWMRRHPDLRDAVNEARDEADAGVVNALRQRALGMVIKEERAFVNPHTGKITKVTLHKEIPPSEVAAMMWLTNRHPDEWRWRRSVDDTTSAADSFRGFADAMRSASAKLDAEWLPPEKRRIVYAPGHPDYQNTDRTQTNDAVPDRAQK